MNQQSNNNELAQSVVAIIAILAVVALVEFFLLSMMAGGVGSNQVSNIEDPALIDARLKPVVTLADIRGGSEQKMAVAPVATEKSAKELYDAACMACHANGVAGAPKPGDKAAWEARFANGFDSLLNSVKNGKGAMPAKGGSAYSDAELTKIVEYMLIESDLMTKPAAPAMEKEAMVETPKADMAVEAMPASTVVKSNDVDLVAGEKAYRSACFACHDFGIAGAPKLGDAGAWVGRTDLETLLNSAINGKGAMPPKGGAAYLSDTDIKNIVGFMLSKI